jgi:hypothetical protein
MSLQDRKAAAAIHADHARKAQDRLFQQFAAVFSTDDGQAVLAHLEARFDIKGRTFIATETGTLCPLRAAVRDGERAAVNYILTLIEKANHPNHP